MADLTYPILMAITALYALLLEWLRRNPQRTYAPRWTWLMVVIGCSLVLGVSRVRIALEGPAPAEWGWAVVFWHFVAAAAPIVVWSVLADLRDADAALRAALERRRED